MSHSSGRSSRSSAQKFSDDSGYYSAEGDFFCSIEAHVAGKDKFRVVGHGIIRPYPLQRQACSEQMANVVTNSVEARSTTILNRYGIQATRSLSRRCRPLEEVVHTYLIQTTNTNSTNWKNAAIEINHLFLNAGVAQDDIEVEIINPSLSIHQISTALRDDPEMLGPLEGTRSMIINFLQSHAPAHWTSVAFHTRHHKFRPNAPREPTILVFFRIGAVSRYETLEKKLAALLKPGPSNFPFEFLSGEIDLCPLGRPELPLQPMGFIPRNGDSIGRRGDDTEAGTLGGWLMLKFPNNKQVKCAMTCFHVVAGQNIPNSSALNTKALNASTSNNMIEVEYPAAYDRKYAIQEYKGRLQSKSSPEEQADSRKELDTLEQRDKSPVIGTVIYASGVRQNQAGRRMDWALIETPSTYSVNVPPPAASFRVNSSRWPSWRSGPITYKTDANSRVRTMGKIEVGNWVAKTGRSSGESSGEINRLRRAIKWQGYNNFVTQEIDVFGLSDDFAEPGDSGAFVTNQNHELVGMVIGRDASASDFDLGIITDIREIEQDVKAMCGATFVLPG